MPSVPFFLGHKKNRFWYILFYILSLPVYIFGLYLLLQIHGKADIQTREFVLTIFSFGYFLLALTSLINTIWYMKVSKQVFWSLFAFLGVQVVFWMIGSFIGNNYFLLFLLFLSFLLAAVFGNLYLLKKIHQHTHIHQT